MMIRRGILASVLSATLLATAGCQAGGVVYVDEQGRELAVDGAGRPILTPPARAPMPNVLPSLATTQPAAAKAPVAAARSAEDGYGITGGTFSSEPRRSPPTTRSPTTLAPTTRAPTAQPAGTPVADPSWGLAPAAVSGPGTLPAAAPAVPPKKVDSSAVLDLPPAG